MPDNHQPNQQEAEWERSRGGEVGGQVSSFGGGSGGENAVNELQNSDEDSTTDIISQRGGDSTFADGEGLSGGDGPYPDDGEPTNMSDEFTDDTDDELATEDNELDDESDDDEDDEMSSASTGGAGSGF